MSIIPLPSADDPAMNPQETYAALLAQGDWPDLIHPEAVMSGIRRLAAVEAQLAEATKGLAALGKAIALAAIEGGIISPDTGGITGPQLEILCRDLGEGLKEMQARLAAAEAERDATIQRAERAEAMLIHRRLILPDPDRDLLDSWIEDSKIELKGPTP